MRPTGSVREPLLRTLIGVLRRRKRVIAFCTLLAVGAALGFSVAQKPVYAATSEVLLRTGDPGSQPAPSRAEAARAARTEILVIESRAVRERVTEQLGFRPEISASQVGDTDVIRIRAESGDPGRAVQAADAYATTYVELRKTQIADELAKGRTEIQTKLADVDRRIGPTPAGPEKDRLTAERERLQQSLDQLEVDTALSDSYVKVLTLASAPGSPARPRTIVNALMGLGIGLLAGLLVAALIEALDDSVRTRAQLERVLRDVPVMGVIPAADPKVTGRRQLVTLEEPQSATAEAYRKLRAALQFAARDRPMQTIQVTSPDRMQGKTTAAANLGVVLAQAGLQVVVVCCDLRRPRVHELFGLDNSTGFTSVLQGEVPLSAAIREEQDQPGLAVLPSGPLPSNPSELLSSMRTVEVLTSLQAVFDVVLLDTPPVLAAADAVVLSRRVDATLLVGVAEVTTKRDAARAAEALRQVDAPLIGAVLHGGDIDVFDAGSDIHEAPAFPPDRETAEPRPRDQ